ncbi:MAG TPA: hypothetical protein VFN92_06475 [Solirubrobacterales bacterium]|nr:hypothetical protein [Solirubrobacterales bacterium]
MATVDLDPHHLSAQPLQILQVGLAEAVQVLDRDRRLERPASAPDPRQGVIRLQVQEDGEVGRLQLLPHLRVKATDQVELVGVLHQDPREDQVLVRGEVGQDPRRAVLHLDAVPAHEDECQLELEEVAEPVAVEGIDEGVALDPLVDGGDVGSAAEGFGGRRLPRTDQALDRDEGRPGRISLLPQPIGSAHLVGALLRPQGVSQRLSDQVRQVEEEQLDVGQLLGDVQLRRVGSGSVQVEGLPDRVRELADLLGEQQQPLPRVGGVVFPRLRHPRVVAL